MPTAIGSLLQSGSVRSAPLPDPGSADRADTESFRATLDDQVRRNLRGTEDRPAEVARDEPRSGAAGRDEPESEDRVDDAAAETSDDPQAGATDETDVVRDATGQEGGEGADLAEGEAVESASFAGAVVATRDSGAGPAAASGAALAETTGSNGQTSTGTADGAARAQGAWSPQAAETGSLVGDGANEQHGSDAGGEQALRGSVAADLKPSGEGSAADAAEAVRFADRLASRVEHQAATPGSGGQEGPVRLIETSPATGQDARTALASNARTVTDVLQAQSADDQASVTSVNRGLAAVVKQNGGSITIKLVPESLGPLKIQMSIEGGHVDVRFDAANEQARDMLLRNADMLRQSLTNKGLSVDRVQVHAAPASNESADGRGAQSRQDSAEQQHRQDAGREQSRGYSDRRGEEQGSRQAWRDGAETFSSAWRIALNTTA